jgi:hypothetical protein
MRRTPVPVSRRSRPALRHDHAYLDYRTPEPDEAVGATDADDEPTERFAKVTATSRVHALPPIFARRLDPHEPVADAEPAMESRGVARFFDWLGRPRPG